MVKHFALGSMLTCYNKCTSGVPYPNDPNRCCRWHTHATRALFIHSGNGIAKIYHTRQHPCSRVLVSSDVLKYDLGQFVKLLRLLECDLDVWWKSATS